MIIVIDPRVDIVFKKLFGSPEHPELTKSFVNAMLEAAGLPAAVNLTIQNPFRLAEFEGEKNSELDILYRDERGKDIQLEMQIVTHLGLSQRMIHNWAELYYRQLGKGQEYFMHKPVISIWVLNESLFGDKQWFHHFCFHCPRTGMLLHNDASIMTIELPVWFGLNQDSEQGILRDVEKWNYFLTQALGHEDEMLVSTLHDPVFKEAVEIMTVFTKSEKMRHAYDMRKNYQGIIASYKRTGYEEGKAAGLADGKAEGKAEAVRETARKMKDKQMSAEDIAEVTGLPLDEILAL